MNVIIITRAYNINTPMTISFKNKFSNFKCMKKVITVLTLILAIIRATATVRAPRCQPVTETEIVVSASRIINTTA
jgi:hypothetical protein